MDRLQGVRHHREQTDDGQEQGENVLDQKQRRRPLNIVDDPPPLVYHAGHGGKIGIQQHQTCQLTCRLRTAGHGHGAVRLLHGKQVVHAVTGHGHGVLFLLQGLNQALFLLGRHPPEYCVLECRFPQLLRSLQSRRVYVPVAVRDASLLGNHTDRSRIVAGDHLYRNALLGEVGKGLLGIGPQFSGEQGQGHRLHLFGVQLSRGQGPVISGYQQNTVALLRPVTDVPDVLPVAQQEFRRAHHIAAAFFKFAAAPLVFRGKRHPVGTFQVAFPGKQLLHGLGGCVVRHAGTIHGRQNVLQLLRQKRVAQRQQVFHLHVRLRNGAGLVNAEHIYPCQGLDAVHILHQHPAFAEFLGRYCQSHAGQQIQPLGNHADQCRHGPLGALPQRQLQNHVFLPEQDNAHGHQSQPQKQDQPVQGPGHFGFLGLGIVFCFPGQSRRAAVFAHCRQFHPSPARQHDAAGMDLISGLLLHAVLFAGKQRFVHIEGPRPQNAVGADLVPLSEFRDVVPDDVLRGDILHSSVPDDLHRPPGNQRQLIHCPFGPDFLEDTDDRIDHHYAQKAHVHDRRLAHDQQHSQHDKYQIEEGQGMTQDDFLLAFARVARLPSPQALRNALLRLR